MSHRKLTTHLLAALAGALAVASWPLASGALAGGKEVPETAPAKSIQRGEAGQDSVSSREMLEALRWMPMSPQRRRQMESGLWMDWAKSDPKGLLTYLEGRAWPQYSGLGLGSAFSFRQIFGELAIKDPGYLIAYARRHGSIEAWYALCQAGDPNRIFALLASEKEPVPPGIYSELFEKGAAVASSFHKRITEIADPAARAAAFEGAAPALLDLNRIDDFVHLLADSGLEAERAGEEFGKLADEHPELAGEIGKLPPAARLHAVVSIMHGLELYSPDEESLRRVLLSLNQNGWWGWTGRDAAWAEKLEQLISVVSGGKRNADPWYDWALQLPDGAAARVMKKSALLRWAERPGSDWQPRLAAITDPALRDMAAAVLAKALPQEEAMNVIDTIVDEGLRNEAAGKLKEPRVQEDPNDLFAE